MKQGIQARLGSGGIKSRLGVGIKQRLNSGGRGRGWTKSAGVGYSTKKGSGRSIGVGDVRAKLIGANKGRIQDARSKLVSSQRFKSDDRVSNVSRSKLTVQIQTKSDSKVKLTGAKKLVKTVKNELKRPSSTTSFNSKAPLSTKIQITNDMYKPTVQIANEYHQPQVKRVPVQSQLTQHRGVVPTVLISNDSVIHQNRPLAAPTPRLSLPTARKNVLQLSTSTRDDGRLKPPPQVLKLRRESRVRDGVIQRSLEHEDMDEIDEPMFVERHQEVVEPRVRLNTAKPKPPSQPAGPLKLAGGVLAQSKGALTRSTAREDSGLSHILSSFGKSRTQTKRAADASAVTSQDFASPLQGCKVIVTNLCDSVSEEDVVELFGSIGALKRARMLRAGQAEVVFVQRSHALLACRKFHNRELDGIPMQLKILTPAPKEDALLPAEESKKLLTTQSGTEKMVVADKSLVTKSLFGPKPSKTNVDFVVKI